MNDLDSSRVIQALALRYSEKFAPPQGTIQAHQDVIDKEGYVWYGKLGKTISDKAINSLMTDGEANLLLIDSGKTNRFWAKIVEIKKSIPDDKKFPAYYEENLDLFTVWFKVTEIKRAQSDILAYCTVASSGTVLSEASKRSMSPFFMINVEERYV